MPLQHGSSREVISSNIREMVAAGHPQRQAVAAALRMADEARRAMGGRTGLAIGGLPSMASEIPWFERQEAREEMFNQPKFVASAIPGRTDRHNMDVPAGTYVLPADVVSGLGEGSSLAGAQVVQKMLGTGPFGVPLPREGHRDAIPRPPAPYREPGAEPHLADGGMALVPPSGANVLVLGTPGARSLVYARGGATPDKVPIVVAGGEMLIPPNIVQNHPKLGNGDMKRGHDVLDAFVKHVRGKTIKTLQKLPGPKK